MPWRLLISWVAFHLVLGSAREAAECDAASMDEDSELIQAIGVQRSMGNECKTPSDAQLFKDFDDQKLSPPDDLMIPLRKLLYANVAKKQQQLEDEFKNTKAVDLAGKFNKDIADRDAEKGVLSPPLKALEVCDDCVTAEMLKQAGLIEQMSECYQSLSPDEHIAVKEAVDADLKEIEQIDDYHDPTENEEEEGHKMTHTHSENEMSMTKQNGIKKKGFRSRMGKWKRKLLIKYPVTTDFISEIGAKACGMIKIGIADGNVQGGGCTALQNVFNSIFLEEDPEKRKDAYWRMGKSVVAGAAQVIVKVLLTAIDPFGATELVGQTIEATGATGASGSKLSAEAGGELVNEGIMAAPADRKFCTLAGKVAEVTVLAAGTFGGFVAGTALSVSAGPASPVLAVGLVPAGQIVGKKTAQLLVGGIVSAFGGRDKMLASCERFLKWAKGCVKFLTETLAEGWKHIAEAWSTELEKAANSADKAMQDIGDRIEANAKKTYEATKAGAQKVKGAAIGKLSKVATAVGNTKRKVATAVGNKKTKVATAVGNAKRKVAKSAANALHTAKTRDLPKHKPRLLQNKKFNLLMVRTRLLHEALKLNIMTHEPNTFSKAGALHILTEHPYAIDPRRSDESEEDEILFHQARNKTIARLHELFDEPDQDNDEVLTQVEMKSSKISHLLVDYEDDEEWVPESWKIVRIS